MKKQVLTILIIMLLAICLTGLVGCSFLEQFTQKNNGTQEEEPKTLQKFTVTVVNGIGGGEFEENTTITVMADIKTGKTFVGWSNGIGIVDTEESYTFTVVSDVTLTATYRDNTPTTKSYSIMVKADGATFTTQSVKDGESLQLIAQVPTGYRFDKWVDGEGTTLSTNSNAVIYPTKDMMITAKMIKQYKVTLVGGEGAGTYDAGSEITLTAPVVSHKTFAKWTDEEDNILGTTATITYIVTKNVTITPCYNDILYTITANNGTISPVATDGKYVEGSTVSLSAEDREGEYFVGWYEKDQFVNTNNPYSFEVVADRELTAHFSVEDPTKTYFDIVIKADGTTPTTQRAEEGKTIQLMAVAPTGYRFDKWVNEAEELIATQGTTTVTATQNQTYIAKFVKTYVIIVENGTGGGTYDVGETITVTANTTAGYRFDKWTLKNDTNTLSTSTTYTFEVNSDLTLTAKFIKTYTVTVEGGTGGGTFDEGASVTVTANITAGCRFDKWTLKNSTNALSTSTTYTFEVNSDLTLTAIFIKTYTVTVEGGTGGGTYDEGASVTVVATPPEGYAFTKWTMKNSSVTLSTSATYTFTLAKNMNLVAKTGKLYSLSVENGTGSGNYVANSTVKVVASVPEGYRFDKWTLSGSTATYSGSASLTLTITEDLSLEAHFIKQYTITVVGGTGGGTVDTGASVTLTALDAPSGSSFVGWKKNDSDTIVGTNKTYTFTASENATYTAVFRTDEWTEILS